VAQERALWLAWLAQRGLPHTAATANFVFFDAGRPQAEVAEALRAQGIEIGRGFAPYAHWLRITIGRAEDNQRVRRALTVLLGLPALA
jgi:histidinol-phosphate aminotransferase